MLKIDKTHKKIDLRDIDLEKAKELGVKLGASALTIFMLSGCAKKPIEEHVSETEIIPTTTTQETVIESIPEETIIETTMAKRTYDIKEHDGSELVNCDAIFGIEFDDGRKGDADSLTYDDLAHVVSCIVIVNDNYDYEFLNHMPNLKKLTLTDVSSQAKLANIDGSRFAKGISIKISSPINGKSFDYEKYGFLYDMEEIDTLSIGDSVTCMNISNSFMEKLVHGKVHNLQLGVGYDSNVNTDFTDLESLELLGRPYDIAMYFTNNDIDRLLTAKVKLTIENEEKVTDANVEIDEIVEKLGVSKDATPQEKLDKVLTYVLNEYTYDPDVKDTVTTGGKVSKDIDEMFYEAGYLTAGMKKETQICGNYAAMTSTLLKRLGVDSINLSSSNHAWVAVKVGDYYFYCDPTWLDQEYIHRCELAQDPNDPTKTIEKSSGNVYAEEIFKEDDKHAIGSFSWYLVDPTEVDDIRTTHKESHILLNVPGDLTIKDVPEEVEDAARYKVTATKEDAPKQIEETRETIEETHIIDDEQVQDITDKKFHVNINGKTIIIGASAFIGILAALGVGKIVHDKKEMERRRRRRQRFRDPFDDDYGRRY